MEGGDNKLMIALRELSHDELKHYGIPGMKWGVRRYQPYPDGSGPKGKFVGKKNEIKKNIAEKNTKKEAQYKAQYKSEGYSEEESSKRASERIEADKALKKIALGVGAGAAVYAGYKFYDNNKDRLIPEGTTIQNIAKSSEGVRDSFYGATNKFDKVKYQGMYGKQIQAANPGASVFNKSVKTLGNIKQASPNAATKTLKTLAESNPDFKKDLQGVLDMPLGLNPALNMKMMRANKSLEKGKVDKHVYEALNILMVDHRPETEKVTRQFKDALTKQGYNAIRDVNDKKYSGYKANNPIIFFNTEGKVEVSSVQKISQSVIDQQNKKAIGMIIGSTAVVEGSSYVLSKKARENMAVKKKHQQDTKAIKRFRKRHKSTKMNNEEVLERLGRREPDEQKKK